MSSSFLPHLRSQCRFISRLRTPVSSSVRSARHPRITIPRPTVNSSITSPSSILSSPPPHVTTTSLTVPQPTPNGILSPTDAPSLLLHGSQLAIVRQLEMLNVLIGYEQANQYAIMNELGQSIGYIVEKDTLGRSLLRNFLHTHRPMHAMVLNIQGQPLFTIHRPFNWINSTITISRSDTGDEIGTVEQEWHLWRRRYNLFCRHQQFARIDAPILSWEFTLTNESNQPIGIIDRNFTGLGREIFTDTGHYAIHFTNHSFNQLTNNLTLDERAVTLAAAVTIDFDYFSRSRGGFMPMGGIFWFPGGWRNENDE